MKFSCDQCHAQYMIADEKVGDRGVKVKCKKCGHVIIVKPAAAAEAPDAAPEAASAPSAPPPGDQLGGAFDSMFGGGAPAMADTTTVGPTPGAPPGGWNDPTATMSQSQLSNL